MTALDILKKHMLVDGYPIVLDLQKSEGCHIYDKISGKRYLDFFSFFASAPLGMNHPKLTTKEFKDKLAYVAVNKPSNSDFYTDELAEFVDTLEKIGMPDFLPNLFLISGGALAVENALKAAFDWKVRKNFSKGIKEEKGHQIIHFKEAFHGRTGYTLSLTNTFDPRKYIYFPRFNWPRVLNPKITFPLEKNIDEVKHAEEQSLSEIREAISSNKDDIAGIIIEPIQGEGGDNHFRPEFFHELRKIADEEEIILIYDEVQTGVGLTGKFWAFEHFGEKGKPDIISFGKKMQVCGIMASDRIKEVENNVFEESSRINSTWGGNLIDIVRATKYLEVIKEENLVENASKQGEYILKLLTEIQEKYPDKINNVRGKGLMIAFDLPNSEIRDKLKNIAFDKELIILPSGSKSIRFRPPLIINQEIIDEVFSILEESIKEVQI
ncbi:MAG: L-lysine 6-transaminase [Candidatus Heimdallarchaeum endolithica]|uniref:L-lysine-epsilon aminotransferase n=1 Tax=Candidatus Heimdallarchaeum endolithica TaxID=2876572 RepID=A0A9Y1BSH5_9ARCH|nr:MAG: L-lysine 6-transaminase [Candidatus Heimdallarchaeum endolithica]